MSLIRNRAVQITAAIWILGTLLAAALTSESPPFDRPALADESTLEQITGSWIQLAWTFLLIVVVIWLTRNPASRQAAAEDLPAAKIARRETTWVIGYGIAAQLGGLLLGRLMGVEAISFHLPGTLFGTHDAPTIAQTLTWAGYNFVMYAVLPLLYFRRRYSAKQLNLVSRDRVRDLRVIVVVLLLETAFQLAVLGVRLLHLHGGELLIGAPLTFVLYFLAAVLPTMVFVQCILVPRYLAITGSPVTTAILGGVTYAMLHFFSGWANFESPKSAVLSVIFLFGTYFGPGVVKAVLTLRTGNAWVHVWAYHALAPHTLHDSGLIAKVFKL